MSFPEIAETKRFAVSVKNVDFAYVDESTDANLEALRNLSFSVKKGEFVSLLGPSGCGKTTLLRLIGGLMRLQRGEITKSSLEADIGFVFQSPNLFPWLDTSENILLPVRVQTGRVSATNRDTCARLLSGLGLGTYGTLYPWQLSLGMQMRANLGRALINRPDMLLLDEPFSALDALTSLKLQRDILRIWREQAMTCICVTHNIVDAVSLSDRVLLLSARPATVLKEYNISAPRGPTEVRSLDAEQSRLVREIVDDMQAGNSEDSKTT